MQVRVKILDNKQFYVYNQFRPYYVGHFSRCNLNINNTLVSAATSVIVFVDIQILSPPCRLLYRVSLLIITKTTQIGRMQDNVSTTAAQVWLADISIWQLTALETVRRVSTTSRNTYCLQQHYCNNCIYIRHRQACAQRLRCIAIPDILHLMHSKSSTHRTKRQLHAPTQSLTIQENALYSSTSNSSSSTHCVSKDARWRHDFALSVKTVITFTSHFKTLCSINTIPFAVVCI